MADMGLGWMNDMLQSELGLEKAQQTLSDVVLDESASLSERAQRIKAILDDARDRLSKPRNYADDGFTPLGNLTYPYFGFLPYVMGQAIPDGATIQWEAPCFANTTLSVHTAGKNSYKLILQAEDQKGFLCADNYLFMTVEGAALKSVDSTGVHVFDWTVADDASTAEQWDVHTNGVRAFRFDGDVIELILDLIDTVMLFVPELTQPVGHEAAEYNLDFLQKYAGRTMEPRSVDVLDMPMSAIQSGDFFGVIRLDGLDPMLGWAMGSTTGHTTVALEIDGAMHICESTAKDSYWPVNGIQCTPYAQWVQMAKAAGYNVVHAPLNAEYRAKFDVDKAVAFVKTVLGLDYGYHNMLYGWIDTIKDNYPCTPPDYTKCLTWELVECAFSLVDKLVPSIGDLMWNQAWNLRLGTSGLRTADLLYLANQKGLSKGELPTIVEQDDWMYNTTRYNSSNHVMGKSMVCCVFVCNVWKHAGIFESIHDELNCAELTNWDDYSLAIFDTDYDKRPEVCKQADPNNPLCQIVGNYTLHLNNYNSKAFYPHIAEKCPTLPPHYSKPANC